MRTRIRSIPDWYEQVSQNGVWTTRRSYPSPGPPWTTTVQSMPLSRNVDKASYPPGYQKTADEIHPRWKLKDKPSASDGDFGGEFDSTSFSVGVLNGRLRVWDGTPYHESDGSWTRATYVGPYLAINPSTIRPPTVVRSSDATLDSLGTTAIARCKPTNSIANVATMLGEIYLDGLPALAGTAQLESRTLLAKSGNEYLNSEFGWKPLISDVNSVAFAAANYHRILSDYERNSGKVVRRRYVFPVETTVTEEDLGLSDGFVLAPVNGQISLPRSGTMPRLFRHTVQTKEIWFSGAFTYHLPVGYKSRNRLVSAAAKAQHLLGVELTPETVWNLAPWSWAVDWFSNAGDVVSNLSDWASDGLVLKYGYIMERIVHEETYYLNGPGRYQFTGGSFASPVTVRYTSKRRRAATPFGFGLNWNSFSPRQLAITVALGITRVFR